MSFAVILPPVASLLTSARREVRAAVASALSDPDVTRLVVDARDTDATADDAGYAPDTVLALVIAALMVEERLDVQVGYVAADVTPATRVYRLPTGEDAAAVARTGTARPVPLIRDDAATVLVGHARHVGADDAPLRGESYLDEHRLFTGTARGVVIVPTPGAPGLRARLDRRLPGGWRSGRAVQTGGTNLTVEREGVRTPRPVKRSTFYRHHVDLALVLP